jgi:hypothetical protein
MKPGILRSAYQLTIILELGEPDMMPGAIKLEIFP